jgi:hypothetical protein
MEQRPSREANSPCVGRSLLIVWCCPKCCEVVVSDREILNVRSFSEAAILMFACKYCAVYEDCIPPVTAGIRSGCHPFAKHAVKLC